VEAGLYVDAADACFSFLEPFSSHEYSNEIEPSSSALVSSKSDIGMSIRCCGARLYRSGGVRMTSSAQGRHLICSCKTNFILLHFA
jgi:hypothetical protein